MSKGDMIVNLIAVVDATAQRFEDLGTTYPDSNTSEGFGQILEGIVLLLNENLGRWDGGTLWGALEEIANRVRWSLDDAEVNYE